MPSAEKRIITLPCPNPDCEDELSYDFNSAPKQVTCGSCKELIDININDDGDLKELNKELDELDKLFK
jgi:hypothetical protein